MRNHARRKLTASTFALVVSVAASGCQESSRTPMNVELATDPGRQILTPAALSDGLVAYYPFDGNAVDATGNGHNGSLLGGVHFGEGAKDGGAIFPARAAVKVADHPQLDTDEAMTVLAWVKPTSVSSDGTIFLSKWFSSPIIGDWILRLQPSAERTARLFANAADYDHDYSRTFPGEIYTLYQWVDSPQVPLHQWSFVGMTFGESVLSIYVNGSLVGEVATAFSEIEPDEYAWDDLYIGSFRGGSSSYLFSGGIDEVRIYDRVLSLDEIRTLYFPMTKEQCKKGGWRAFAFRNQGQCVRFVETGEDSRIG